MFFPCLDQRWRKPAACSSAALSGKLTDHSGSFNPTRWTTVLCEPCRRAVNFVKPHFAFLFGEKKFFWLWVIQTKRKMKDHFTIQVSGKVVSVFWTPLYIFKCNLHTTLSVKLFRVLKGKPLFTVFTSVFHIYEQSSIVCLVKENSMSVCEEKKNSNCCTCNCYLYVE